MTTIEKTSRACFGPTGFHPDYDRLPKKLELLTTDEDWDLHRDAEEKQKAELTELELLEDAKKLLQEVSHYWTYGIYAMQGLAALAAEIRRRDLTRDDHLVGPDMAVMVAAWFARLAPELELGTHVPDARDCTILFGIARNSYHDGCGRPDGLYSYLDDEDFD